MSAVLLLIVTDLVVKLLQVVLEGRDFVVSGTNSVLQTHNVLIALLNHLPLVSDAILSRVNLSLHAHHAVL